MLETSDKAVSRRSLLRSLLALPMFLVGSVSTRRAVAAAKASEPNEKPTVVLEEINWTNRGPSGFWYSQWPEPDYEGLWEACFVFSDSSCVRAWNNSSIPGPEPLAPPVSAWLPLIGRELNFVIAEVFRSLPDDSHIGVLLPSVVAAGEWRRNADGQRIA